MSPSIAHHPSRAHAILLRAAGSLCLLLVYVLLFAPCARAAASLDLAVRGRGLGLVNTTAQLRGVQLGLVNYAGNNRSGLRLLPLVNLHL